MKWTEKAVLDELEKVTKQIGRFPNTKDLKSMGRTDLYYGLYNTNKNMKYFSSILGFDKGWTEDNIISNLKLIIEETGIFPTHQYLTKNNQGDLSHAIVRHGGYHYFQEKLGIQYKEKPKKYWKNWSNVEQGIKEKYKELLDKGLFPNAKMLREINPCFMFAINKYFGGLAAVAERMGYNPPNFLRTTDGHYVNSSYEYIVDEFLYNKNIPHEVNGKIKNTNYRFDFKISDYYVEIWGYEKQRKTPTKRVTTYNKKRIKKEKLYHDLNLKLISIECDLFKNPSQIIETELENIFSNL